MRVLCLLSILAACGSSGSGPGTGDDDDTPASLTPQEFAAGRARWTCTWAQRCCQKSLHGIDTTDVEACTQALLAGAPDHLQAALASGGVTFDGEKAATCLEELNASSCDPSSTFDGFADNPTCQAVVQGQHQVGEPCPEGIECSGVRNICVVYENGSRCAGLLELGDFCSDTDKICNPATSLCEGELPFPSMCVARHANGTHCSTSSANDCASGYCDPDSNLCADATSCERI